MQLFDQDGLYVGPEEPAEPGCPICHDSMYWEDCEQCAGDGEFDVYDEDPLWYSPGDTERCNTCDGYGGWYRCSGSHEGKRFWTPNELPKD